MSRVAANVIHVTGDLVSVWRLEFPQPPGWKIAWLGPYTSQWLTADAEELIRHMEAEHGVTHPHPQDLAIFESYPGADRLSCGCASRTLLNEWFGAYLQPLLEQGAYIAEYQVPRDAIIEDSPQQVLFVTRRAAVVERTGRAAPAPVVRSNAGSRLEIIAANPERYAYRP